MTREIIALVDGSIYARSVCDHAVWAATRMEASVELLHVMTPRDSAQGEDLSGAIALGARTALLEEMAELDSRQARLDQRRGRAILDDALEIVQSGGIARASTALRNDDLLDAVTDRECDARMVMIGKRGEAADFSAGRLGANLEQIIRACHHPVFVASRAFKPIEKALIAFDGSASAHRALDFAAQTPLLRGLPIRIVMVGPDKPESRAALETARARLGAGGGAVEAVLTQGKPEQTLGGMIDEEGFGLLVMGAYGHSRIRNLIVGSTTAEMLRSCRAPVAMLR